MGSPRFVMGSPRPRWDKTRLWYIILVVQVRSYLKIPHSAQFLHDHEEGKNKLCTQERVDCGACRPVLDVWVLAVEHHVPNEQAVDSKRTHPGEFPPVRPIDNETERVACNPVATTPLKGPVRVVAEPLNVSVDVVILLVGPVKVVALTEEFFHSLLGLHENAFFQQPRAPILDPFLLVPAEELRFVEEYCLKFLFLIEHLDLDGQFAVRELIKFVLAAKRSMKFSTIFFRDLVNGVIVAGRGHHNRGVLSQLGQKGLDEAYGLPVECCDFFFHAFGGGDVGLGFRALLQHNGSVARFFNVAVVLFVQFQASTPRAVLFLARSIHANAPGFTGLAAAIGLSRRAPDAVFGQ